MDQLRRRARLLAIDDHSDSAELIARVAAKLGYDSRSTASPGLLRDLLASWSPDILTVDICMPEEDGLDVFSLLEQRGFQGRIVIISGYDEYMRRSAGRLAAAKGLDIVGNLSKPIDLKALRGLLAELEACM